MASIQKRTLQNGETSYRVQVRLKGFEVQRATFDRLTDAKKWAQSTEAALLEGRHFKINEAKKHTVEEMIDRYVKRLERDNPKRLNDIDHLLKWWKKELGFCVLADLNRSLISAKLEKLSQKKAERWNRKTERTEVNFISPATVNRYGALSKELIVQVLHALKQDELNESQRKYLIECLDRTLSTGDAQKGFLLKYTNGKNRKPTGLRDRTATMLMILTEGQGLNYEDRLKLVVQHINKQFSDNVSVDTIETAYAKNRAQVLADMERSAEQQDGLFIRVK